MELTAVHYRFFGLKTDLNKILNTFSYSSSDSATAGSWRSTVLNNNYAELNSVYNTTSPVNKVPDVTGLGFKRCSVSIGKYGIKSRS